MDRRTRILALVFGSLILAAVARGLIYPTWINPRLGFEREVATKHEELERLQERSAQAVRAKEQYRRLAARVGSLDIGDVINEMNERLIALIDKHGFNEAKINSRGGSTKQRKTNLMRSSITVTARCRLESAVAFLKEVAELPHLLRVGNLKMSPAGSRRKSRSGGQMNVTIPIELMVLPQQKFVGRIKESELEQPEAFVRHTNHDYSVIWTRKPFNEYEPPALLVASAGKDVKKRVGDPVNLQGAARGGDGNYSYQWSPAERLTDAASARPTLADTSAPSQEEFTLTVTDGEGKTAKASVKVTLQEKRHTPTRIPEPPEPKVVDTRWPDRRHMQLCMAMRTDTGVTRFDEFSVYNSKSKETTYYTVGDQFNGGELVFVHQRGVLVRRQGEYYVHPIGARLDNEVPAEEAVDLPELMAAAEWLRANDRSDTADADDTQRPIASGTTEDSETSEKLAETKTKPDGEGHTAKGGADPKGDEEPPAQAREKRRTSRTSGSKAGRRPAQRSSTRRGK